MGAKAQATREAAARIGCVILLKGPETIIATPDGEVRRHSATQDRATPWLATAGAGDVLAGLITGLLARGTPRSKQPRPRHGCMPRQRCCMGRG